MRLSNPLSVEERLQMPRLIGHDFHAISRHLIGEAYFANSVGRRVKYGYMEGIYYLSGGIIECINDLVCLNELQMESPLDRSLFQILQIGANASSGMLKVDSKTREVEGLTKRSVIQTAMFNLVRNGIKARGNTSKKVELTSSFCDEFPKDTLYIPEGSSDFKGFIRFEFTNEGAFPGNISIMDRLTGPPPVPGSSGFGLYFLGRAAKVLRMPVDIKSGDNLTKVTLYHPIYDSD